MLAYIVDSYVEDEQKNILKQDQKMGKRNKIKYIYFQRLDKLFLMVFNTYEKSFFRS